MEKIFLSFHFSNLLKGKQRSIQILVAGTILALGLVSIPGLIRFASGLPIGFGDFISLLLIIYALINLLFIVLQKPSVKAPEPDYMPAIKKNDFNSKKASMLIPPSVQPMHFKLVKEDAVGETLIN